MQRTASSSGLKMGSLANAASSSAVGVAAEVFGFADEAIVCSAFGATNGCDGVGRRPRG